jgi:transcriptional regulator with XRE-family HTH domain
MFDDRVGAILRGVRIRRGLRQVDVARAASVSTMTVSRLERGQLEELTVQAIRRVGRALEVRMDFAPWSRHGDLLRFATAAHAALVESVIRELVRLDWDARAEVSFNHERDRGFIDILAWHAATRTLLVIEIKTEIVDVGELLGTFDRKRRLAASIARQFGWEPLTIAAALIVEDTSTNRRRIGAHAATIRTQLPDDGRRVHAFMRNPAGSQQRRGSVRPLTGAAGAPGGASVAAGVAAVAGVAFWSIEHPGVARQRRPGARRVRRATSCSHPLR